MLATVTQPDRWTFASAAAPGGWIEVRAALGLVVAWCSASEVGVAFTSSLSGATSLLSQIVERRAAGVLKMVGDAALMEGAVANATSLGFKIQASKPLPVGPCQAFLSTEGTLRFAKPPAAPRETPTARVRIFIVDDSKTMRQVMRSIFARDPELEIVGECGDPFEAEGLIQSLKPDVVSLDIQMPGMDGVTLARRLVPAFAIPIIMVTALGKEQGDQVMQALAAGAVDYIQKPALDEIAAAAADICQRFKMAAHAKVSPSATLTRAARRTLRASSGERPVIVIGSSTGGTEAVAAVLAELPKNIPPILIVQHIPPVFSKAFADRLARDAPFEVAEARDGDAVRDGRVLIAPGGFHMDLQGRGGDLSVRVFDAPVVTGHKPSVNVLFRSAARVLGPRAIGVILTGMGKDGAEGLKSLRDAGARTLGQDEATSVVYGMPRAAKQLGAVETELPLGDVAQAILELTERWPSRKAE